MNRSQLTSVSSPFTFTPPTGANTAAAGIIKIDQALDADMAHQLRVGWAVLAAHDRAGCSPKAQVRRLRHRSGTWFRLEENGRPLTPWRFIRKAAA